MKQGNQKVRAREFRISKQTAVDWDNFHREGCCRWMLANQQGVKIGGPGKVVEVDEMQYKRKKHGVGRKTSTSDVWVMGGVERGSQRIFLVIVKDRTKQTLQSVIERYVKKGTTVITDAHVSYTGLSEKGYTHKVVNHKYHFVKPTDVLTHTQSQESIWQKVSRRFLLRLP